MKELNKEAMFPKHNISGDTKTMRNRIIMIDHVTQARDGRAEFGKPNSWSLFKALKCTSKVTNLV